MKIAVCCKAVPGMVAGIEVGDGGKSIRYQGELLSINECDEYALEEALALRRVHAGHVTAITMGGIKSLDVLYYALAKGADRAVRVDFESDDPRIVSAVLAAALRKLEFDLVLTGTQSRDTLGGQVGIGAACMLGLPFAYSVVDVQVDEKKSVKVRKEMGGGRYAEVEIMLPALLCVQTGIRPLTFVPPVRRARARQQPVASFSPADLGLAEEAMKPRGYRFLSVHPPERKQQAQFLQGRPQEIAAALLAKIRESL